jgi:predicted alpha/beta superfamily hydrolase
MYPEVFGKLAVLSPSVWWDNKAILNIIANCTRQSALSNRSEQNQERPTLRIWLSMGTDESKTGVHDSNLLRNALVARGWREGADLHYQVIKGGKHEEAAWAESVGPMLRYLFPPTPSGK